MFIICEVEKLLGKIYDLDGDNMSFKVIVDYICVFLFVIGDGVFFGNEGCGYVFCCFFCCVVMYGCCFGINEIFFYKLVLIVG